MKIQDILFLVVLVVLLLKRDSRLLLIAGLFSILLSIPLFYLQIFFTAQHLVYYAFFFILASAVFMLAKERFS